MKILAKRIIFSVLATMGAVYRTKGVPILFYHSVDDEISPISTPIRMFRLQMEYLNEKGITVLSMKELYTELASGNALPEKAVVITFDDAFESVLNNAAPILKEFGYPSTVFAVTDYIGEPMGWERIEGIPSYRLCSWDELKQMEEYGIDVQSHTMSHNFMTEMSEQEIASEVEGSISAIEQNLNKKVEFLAYPYGVCNPRVLEVMKETQILAAVTGKFGKVNTGDDPHSLNRIGTELVSGRDFEMLMDFFRSSMTGSASLYVWLREHIPFLVRTLDRAEYK